jgi:hypothetical protein
MAAHMALDDLYGLGADHYAGPALSVGLGNVARTLATVHHGVLPVPALSEPAFWNTYLVDALPELPRLLVDGVLGLGLLSGALLLLLRRPAVALAFGLGSLAMLAISGLFWYGQLRHHAQVFLFFVTCYWLALQRPSMAAPGMAEWMGSARWAALADRSEAAQVWGGRVFTGILGVQVALTAFALTQDWARPFSAGRATGAYLSSRDDLRGALFVGSPDYAMQSVAAYFDERFYHLESGTFATFVDWGEGRKTITVRKAFREAASLARREERRVVLVLAALPEPHPAIGEAIRIGERAHAVLVAAFEGAIAPDESFYVFELERLDEP